MERPPGILPQSVPVQGRLAAKLLRELGPVRGRLERDEELSALLSRFLYVASEWQAAAVPGTEPAPRPEVDASSTWMTTAEVGVFLGVSARWVRGEVLAGRLTATRLGPSWAIERRDAEALREMRRNA